VIALLCAYGKVRLPSENTCRSASSDAKAIPANVASFPRGAGCAPGVYCQQACDLILSYGDNQGSDGSMIRASPSRCSHRVPHRSVQRTMG
jgi:hypothetical protein